NGTSGSNGALTIASGAAVTIESATGIFTIGNSANDITGGGGGATVTAQGLGGNATVLLTQASDYVGNWILGNQILQISADNQLGNPEIGKHTSELQSPYDLVCRLLLEKKKIRESLLLHQEY